MMSITAVMSTGLEQSRGANIAEYRLIISIKTAPLRAAAPGRARARQLVQQLSRASDNHITQFTDAAQDVIAVFGVLHPRGQLLNHAHAMGRHATFPQSRGHVRFDEVQVVAVVCPEHMSAAVDPQPQRQPEKRVVGSAELRDNAIPAVGRPRHFPASDMAARQATQPATRRCVKRFLTRRLVGYH